VIPLALVYLARLRQLHPRLLAEPNSQCKPIGFSKDYKPMIQKMQWVSWLVKTGALSLKNLAFKVVLVPNK
jgi:hypothetical protein